ncbi:hypothetical protein ATANTOWER_024072 [Ataeniobius toweri]|uniref:Uncharacterized protein n=1 Tax=Ataeniobius toweri TaxID=208326 RepID=A0ABU7C977_9TELE|nr:hypothetical protein [Ataeniobius toweri]
MGSAPPHREEPVEVTRASIPECLLDALLRRCSRHITPGRGPWDGPGHAGGTISLGWPGNALGSPTEVLEKVSGERDIWVSLLSLLPPHPVLDKVEDYEYEELLIRHCFRSNKIESYVFVCTGSNLLSW